MITEQKAKALVSYLQNLPDFTISEREFYDHMGAIIVDAMLQAGANWNAVKERRDKIKANNNAKTTSGFLSLLKQQRSISSFLDWEGRKVEWVLNLSTFFVSEGVETTSDLRRWMENHSNQNRILKQKGIGKKTKDYLLKLSGSQSIPIDRYWFKCLDNAQVSYTDYDEAQRIVEHAAQIWGIDKAVLDTSVWRYFRQNVNRNSCG